LFRALGYKHNAWPMQNLAELKSRWARQADGVLAIQSRLLGIAGLLPGELARVQKSAEIYLRRVWDCWWREREEFSDCLLPRAVWKFHGLRPANHPQRRLALAAHWLADPHFISKIEKWGALESSGVRMTGPAQLLKALCNILEADRDEFWSWHWAFRSGRLPKPQPLLGAARVTDLAVNVVLPWLWIRGACARLAGGREKLQREIERRLFAWPAAEDNAVLKLARQRLLGTPSGRDLRGAAAQQGLMQVVRDFCEHSNALCDRCQLPQLVQSFRFNAEASRTRNAEL
jgi:hypothetical protein